MVSFALHGIGVSGGIAIGRAHLVSHATREVAHYTIPLAQVPVGDRALRGRHPRGAARARRAACGADERRCAGRIRRVPRRALDDPQRSDAVGGAAADHRRAALQRGVGADAADGRAGRAVRADRGYVPARAQVRRAAGRRARAEAPDGPARDAAVRHRRKSRRSSSRTTCRRPTSSSSSSIISPRS